MDDVEVESQLSKEQFVIGRRTVPRISRFGSARNTLMPASSRSLTAKDSMIKADLVMRYDDGIGAVPMKRWRQYTELRLVVKGSGSEERLVGNNYLK